MTRFLIATVLMALAVGTVRADDVQDFVDFQVAKLKTYAEAHDDYKKTKKSVVVWVGVEDFDAWRETRSLATHVFVKEFVHVKQGIVVGGDRKGDFVVLTTAPPGPTVQMVSKIKSAVSDTTRYFIQSNCPNGQCPRR